jgi:hypothetical protein
MDTNNKNVTIYRPSHVDDMWKEVTMEEDDTQKKGLPVLIEMGGYSLKIFH